MNVMWLMECEYCSGWKGMEKFRVGIWKYLRLQKKREYISLVTKFSSSMDSEEEKICSMGDLHKIWSEETEAKVLYSMW